MEANEPVAIEKGYVLVYRLRDVAEEIDLVAVEQILKARAGLSRLRLARSTRQAFHIRNAPIFVSLGETIVRTGTHTSQAETFAKIWDYGVVSFQISASHPSGYPVARFGGMGIDYRARQYVRRCGAAARQRALPHA